MVLKGPNASQNAAENLAEKSHNMLTQFFNYSVVFYAVLLYLMLSRA